MLTQKLLAFQNVKIRMDHVSVTEKPCLRMDQDVLVLWKTMDGEWMDVEVINIHKNNNPNLTCNVIRKRRWGFYIIYLSF